MYHIALPLLLVLTPLCYILFLALRCRQLKSSYSKYLRSLGYRVHQHPYCWLGSQMYTQYKKQQKQTGDANYHYKHHLSECDVIVSNLLFRVMVEIVHPGLIKEFYAKANQGFYYKADYGLGSFRNLMGNENLLMAEGEHWKNRRKILSTVFNYDFIVRQIPTIQDISRQALDAIEKSNTDPQDPRVVRCNIQEPLMNVFPTVILKCFFKGEALSYIKEERTIDFINKMFKKMSELGRSKLGVIFGQKFTKIDFRQKNRLCNQEIELFRSVAKDIVLKRIAEIKNVSASEDNKAVDIIQALMKSFNIVTEHKALAKNGSEVQSLSIDEIIDQFVTFYLVGSQTTLAFTRMMIYRIIDKPEVMEKMREQIEREIKSEQLQYHQLKNLKYFQKVQKQVLRMDSSVGAIFTRQVTKDHYLGDMKLYQGMTVNVRIRAVHFKQSEYPNPNQFDPDRWDREDSINNFAKIPFSSGARNCIGKHLALLENKIFMVEFLRRYGKMAMSKKLSEMKMVISSLYGPEEVETLLTKNK